MTIQNRSLRSFVTVFLATSAVFLGACASKGSPPLAQMAAARASITQAETAGAMQFAPVELLAARDKLGRSEDAVRGERYVDARRLAEQAEADAELAERKARAAKAVNAVEELERGNAALKDEIARTKRK